MSAPSIEAMADLIDRHEYDVDLSRGVPRPACVCGWRADLEWADTKEHSRHIAEAIRAEALPALLTEAKAEALRVASIDLLSDGDYPSAHARWFATWLDARAYRIASEGLGSDQ